MAKIKKVFKAGFTTVSNDFLKDKNLGMKERGLLVTMLSLPDDWEFSVSGLSAILPNSKNGVGLVLKHLEEHGYLQRNKIRTEKGVFVDTEYVFSDSKLTKKPLNSPHLQNRDMDSRDMDSPYMENEAQLNTNKENTNEVNTNKEFVVEDEQKNTLQKNSYKKLQEKVAKHFEESLMNSIEFKRYAEVDNIQYFVEIMNKLTALVKNQNRKKLEMCLDLDNETIESLWCETSKASDNYRDSYNNPDGWVVEKLNRALGIN